MANIVQCEKHGLRYNADIQDGCVICRREAGGGAAPAAPRSASKAAPASRASRSGSARPGQKPMGPALIVTAVLIAATTGAFFLAHPAVAGVVRVFMAQEGGDLLAPGVPGFPDGEYREDAAYDPDEYPDEYGDEYSGDEYDYD
jgi:hypothetical protein